MAITITEALAELKVLKKRLENKRTFYLQNVVRDDRLKDPLEGNGGTKTVLLQELQSIKDLETRMVTLRTAIAKANALTQVQVAGVTQSIADWLIWRRDVAPGVQDFLNAVHQRIEQGKRTELVPSRADGQQMKWAYGVDEKVLLADVEKFTTTLGTLDGQLSLKNATTQIEI
jgi:hypothetical protein